MVFYIVYLVSMSRVLHCNCHLSTSICRLPRPKAIHFSWLGPELSSVAWSLGAQLIIFFCFRFSVVVFDRLGISIRHAANCICRVLVFASS